MKNILIFFVLLCPLFAAAQVITTVAGNGVENYLGDGGPATLACLSNPNSVAFDLSDTPHHGNPSFYIADMHAQVVRKVSSLGIITTYAGNGLTGYSGDGGPATAAIVNPIAVAVDKKGNLYISDAGTGNGVIRKVGADGIITRIAGNGGSHSGDGIPATAAGFSGIGDMDFDRNGNLYFTEAISYIRKIDTFGIVTTVAGTGVTGFSTDGNQATASALTLPGAIALDNMGNIYFSDGSTRIRKVNTLGIISTIAGDGTGGNYGDWGPASAARVGMVYGICVDGYGNIFFADRYYSRIRKISSSGNIYAMAGTGTTGCSGDGGLALAAEFFLPEGIDIDAAGNLLVTDITCNRVRKITPGTASLYETNSHKLSVQPNPAKDVIIIDSEKQVDNVVIYDLLGRSVYSNVFHSQNVDISVRDLPVGLYVIVINHEQVSRFLKE